MALFFTLCIVTGLYYMSILGFAYGVYPHIPASKGGGDFAAAPDVELFIKGEALTALPTEILPPQCISPGPKQAKNQQPPDLSNTNQPPRKTIRLKIIHETETQLFVADPRDRADPEKNLTGPQNWSLWRTPTVTALRKDIILSAVHLPGQEPSAKMSKPKLAPKSTPPQPSSSRPLPPPPQPQPPARPSLAPATNPPVH
jgi:hypothetical protein